jgi:hypothetical protein
MRFVRFSKNLKDLLSAELPSDWRITQGAPKDKTVKLDFRNVGVASGTMTGFVDAFVYSNVEDYAVVKTVYDFLAAVEISGITKDTYGLRSVEMLSQPEDTLKAFRVSIDFSALMVPEAPASGVAPDALTGGGLDSSNGYVSGSFADLAANDDAVVLWETSSGRIDTHFQWTEPVAEFTSIAMRIKTNVQLDVYFGSAYDDPGVTIPASAEWQDFTYTFDDPTTFNWAYLTSSGTTAMTMDLWETGTSGSAVMEIDSVLLS